MIENDDKAVLEVKFKNEVRSYFIVNFHDDLIDYFFRMDFGRGPQEKCL